jgi:hypothetical protein
MSIVGSFGPNLKFLFALKQFLFAPVAQLAEGIKGADIFSVEKNASPKLT